MKRLPEELEILKHNLPCKSLKRHKIGRTIFEVTDGVFSEQKIKWQRSEATDMCANGAVAMAAGLSGLVCGRRKRLTVTTGKSWLQRILTQYYMKPSQGLSKYYMYTKNRPLNARLFRHLYAEVDSEPTAVLCRRSLGTQNVTPLLSRFPRWISYGYIFKVFK